MNFNLDAHFIVKILLTILGSTRNRDENDLETENDLDAVKTGTNFRKKSLAW